MPWTVSRSVDRCSESKPWAVIRDGDDVVEGCHETEEAATIQMRALYASEGKNVETEGRGHILLKAATTVVTDLGQFTAVISTAAVDREKDIVEPEAMVKALRKWPRPVPLAWEHDTTPEGIIGEIDPQSVKAVGLEVIADGQVDLEVKSGQDAWRSIKKRSLGFSFGYLIPDGGATERKGGGRYITELDVFEITACRAPMNNDTRVLGWKAHLEDGAAAVVQVLEPASEQELQKREQENRLSEATKDVPKDTPPAPDPVEKLAEQVESLTAGFEGFRADVEKELEGIKAAVEEPKRANSAKHDPLRMRADQAVLEIESDGISSRKSPPTKQDPPTAPLDESALRARSRRTMLYVLTGDTDDT